MADDRMLFMRMAQSLSEAVVSKYRSEINRKVMERLWPEKEDRKKVLAEVRGAAKKFIDEQVDFAKKQPSMSSMVISGDMEKLRSNMEMVLSVLEAEYNEDSEKALEELASKMDPRIKQKS